MSLTLPYATLQPTDALARTAKRANALSALVQRQLAMLPLIVCGPPPQHQVVLRATSVVDDEWAVITLIELSTYECTSAIPAEIALDTLIKPFRWHIYCQHEGDVAIPALFSAGSHSGWSLQVHGSAVRRSELDNAFQFLTGPSSVLRPAQPCSSEVSAGGVPGECSQLDDPGSG